MYQIKSYISRLGPISLCSSKVTKKSFVQSQRLVPPVSENRFQERSRSQDLVLHSYAPHSPLFHLDKDGKLGFDFAYRRGIREERLRPCLSQRFEAVYNLILLEEVMRQGFQKVPI
jgi:hypothetical protein